VDIVLPRPKRAKLSALRFGVVGVVGALVVVMVVSLWRSTPASASGPIVERSGIWSERVKRGDLVREVPAQGTLVAEHVQWLSATNAARVAKIAVRAGGEVEPDTVVVVLENTDLELAALEADGQVAAAEARLIELEVRGKIDQTSHASTVASLHAELRDADRHAESANRLAPAGLLSENERADAVAHAVGLVERFSKESMHGDVLTTGLSRQLAAQRAEIARMHEVAAFRHRQLAALEVRAGMKGVVEDVPLESGQWVAVGTVLAKVAEPGRLKAEVRVAESHARDVAKGMQVRFDGASAAGTGIVERVDPTVVAGSVRVVVRMDSLPPGARVEQRVSGFVEIENLKDVLYVARPAGVVEGRSAGIFRLDANKTRASRVNVAFGRASARDVEVVDGLGEGDEVVVSDVSAWDNSAHVRLK
jgi:multidrug resistance efflux pump